MMSVHAMDVDQENRGGNIMPDLNGKTLGARKRLTPTKPGSPTIARRSPRRAVTQSLNFSINDDDLEEESDSSRKKRGRQEFDDTPTAPSKSAPELNASIEEHGTTMPNKKRRKILVTGNGSSLPSINTSIVPSASSPTLAAPSTPTPKSHMSKVVSKIISRTTSISSFVRNTPLKFGSLRKSRKIDPETIAEEGIDAFGPRSASTPRGESTSSPSSDFVADQKKKSTSSKKDKITAVDKKRSVSTPIKQLKHSMSLAAIPSNFRRPVIMATIKPPVDAKPYEPMIKEADSWNLELGSCSATPFSIELDATTKLPVSSDAAEQKFYATYFLGKEHLNFVGMSDSGKFMSISLIKDDTHYRAIVRSATGEEKVSMPSNMVKTSASSSSLFKNTPKQVLKAMFPQIKFKSLKAVKDDKHSSDLRLYECNEHHVSFKWGVLYCAKGQTDENDMFQNQETSKHFDEFLANLGETVELLGWKNYTGGLDTTKNATGTHSVYTKHHGSEIMFHVSTMIPYTPGCEQQLERKRHLGNDIVVIVFQDGTGDVYDPNTICTHFQHVLAVVQAEEGPAGCPTRFRVQFARKDGVAVHQPELPEPATFEAGPAFRHFFLEKLVNAERASLKAPAFEKAITRTRLGYLQHFEQQYLN